MGAGMLWCNVGFAEIRLIEKNYIKTKDMGWVNVAVSTFCVDGYKFILAQEDKDKAISLDLKQIFEERNGQSLPAKC